MNNPIYEQCDYKAKKEFVSCNIIEAIVATTGYCGGDSGHGGRTYLKLRNACCTDIEVNRLGSDYDCEGVEIMLGGDTELDTFIDALRWAADELTDFLEMQHNGKIKGINIDYTKEDDEQEENQTVGSQIKVVLITEEMLLKNGFIKEGQGMYYEGVEVLRYIGKKDGFDTWNVLNPDIRNQVQPVFFVAELLQCLKENGYGKIVDNWRD